MVLLSWSIRSLCLSLVPRFAWAGNSFYLAGRSPSPEFTDAHFPAKAPSYTSPVLAVPRPLLYGRGGPPRSAAKPTSGQRAESLQDKNVGEGSGSPATPRPPPSSSSAAAL